MRQPRSDLWIQGRAIQVRLTPEEEDRRSFGGLGVKGRGSWGGRGKNNGEGPRGSGL
ncbi:hypothetical protein H0G86_006685 [Trichoderma simmonsii]|uniref:Uncharacterized protein n=1 Tax=Trichoderma simmonsii TaxID=1491479 RepID=A0A8G0LC10_9HYPO|nr:hypothetical protein H0G86_006685 [Trichoderma simmonsii]